MAQTSPTRSDTPTRLSAVVCLLVLVWIVTYWLWQPRRAGPDQPHITFADPVEPVEPIDEEPTPSTDPPSPPADPLTGPPQPLVEAPRFTDYIVQEGDASMEVISQRHYGSRAHAAAILQANPFVDPTKLVPGRTRLRIPVDPTNVQGRLAASDPPETSGERAPAANPEPPPRVVEYTITRDDTLWDIAEAYYGKGHLWRRIYEANQDVISNPDRPPVGKTIRIPPLE